MAPQRQERNPVTPVTAKYDLMPLLGNAGLYVRTSAFGTEQPVPFGLDTRVSTVQLATEVAARQDTAHDLTFTKTHFASSGRQGLMTIIAAAILILPVAATRTTP